jgi:hypothetical protein
METDIQLVGRIYRDTIAVTKRDNPAYHAALAARRGSPGCMRRDTLTAWT